MADRRYRLIEAADADLERLYEWGIDRFGLKAADQYHYGLIARFAEIAEGPLLWQDVRHIRAGYRRSVYGSHSIYFQVADVENPCCRQLQDLPIGANMKKVAGILARNDKVFVCTYSKLISGAYRPKSDVAVDMCDFAGVGVALRAAIDAYRDEGEVPDWNDNSRVEALLTMAGVKSWGAFMKGAKSVSVRWDGESFELSPSKSEGARGGFSPLHGRERAIPNSVTDEELGAAVIAALEDAE